jgi:hypothetical protein
MPKEELQCPFCPRTSSRGTGLASHIRGAHPKQYESWSRARKGVKKTARKAAVAHKPTESAAGFGDIVASLERQRDAIESALAALRAAGGTLAASVAKRKRGRPRKTD